MHETLDALHDLDEGTEGLDGLDLALERGAPLDGLDLLGLSLGLSLLRLPGGKLSLALSLLGLDRLELVRGGRGLHGEGDAALLRVDGLDPDGHVLVRGDHVGDVLDESILELGDVHEAVVLGAEVDEAAVLLHALLLVTRRRRGRDGAGGSWSVSSASIEESRLERNAMFLNVRLGSYP